MGVAATGDRCVLERILSWSRSGAPVPLAEPHAGTWAAWAGGLYAGYVRTQVGSPPWVGHFTGEDPCPAATRFWKRRTLLQRKVAALALFALAHEKVEQGNSSFRRVAQVYADRYRDLPGGDIPEVIVAAALPWFRSLERCHLITQHPSWKASNRSYRALADSHAELERVRVEQADQAKLDVEPWRIP